jgi:hypothetical protein
MAKGVSRQAWGWGDGAGKPIEVAKQPEILQASPLGGGKDHEKYSAPASAAIRTS